MVEFLVHLLLKLLTIFFGVGVVWKLMEQMEKH